MIKKVISKNVFVVEMWRNTEFLGYCKGGHVDGIAKTNMNLLKATVYNTAHAGEHRIFTLRKFNSEEYTFKLVECIETITMTFYDEYDDIKRGKMEGINFIRIKDKSDSLSEPAFLSEYHNNANERSFASSLDIRKAICFRKGGYFKILQTLTKNYGERYGFYREKYYLQEDRNINVIE